jgi:hypothetical protein
MEYLYNFKNDGPADEAHQQHNNIWRFNTLYYIYFIFCNVTTTILAAEKSSHT